MQFQNATEAVSVAIRCMFERWTALIVTVENQGIPTDRIDNILNQTIDIATRPKRYGEDDYLDLFYNGFEQMQADIEDGSPEVVARQILRIRDAAEKGNFGPAMAIAQKAMTANVNLGNCVNGEDDGDEQADDMMDAVPARQESAVDDDGFTHVARRSRRTRQAPERYGM